MRVHRAVTYVLFLCLVPWPALATANYKYRLGEYVTVNGGRSPDGLYSIATHGNGDLGYDNWHIYLMDAISGQKIGPLEEIRDPLDTAAEGYFAKWSPDSRRVAIIYRGDRHILVKIVYRIANRRAYLIGGPRLIKEQGGSSDRRGLAKPLPYVSA
jgi:hypothetical protein